MPTGDPPQNWSSALIYGASGGNIGSFNGVPVQQNSIVPAGQAWVVAKADHVHAKWSATLFTSPSSVNEANKMFDLTVNDPAALMKALGLPQDPLLAKRQAEEAVNRAVQAESDRQAGKARLLAMRDRLRNRRPQNE